MYTQFWRFSKTAVITILLEFNETFEKQKFLLVLLTFGNVSVFYQCTNRFSYTECNILCALIKYCIRTHFISIYVNKIISMFHKYSKLTELILILTLACFFLLWFLLTKKLFAVFFSLMHFIYALEKLYGNISENLLLVKITFSFHLKF